MNKLKPFLLVVLIAAVVTVVFCSLQYRQLGLQMRRTESELAESRASWESIASEKELRQAELKQLQNDLKEAELSLSENLEKKEELEEDILELRNHLEWLAGPENT